jgi:hypothetical protein
LSYWPNSCFKVSSGKKKGKILERLMFENYSWLDWMGRFLNAKLKEGSKKNNFHLHLEALLQRGEELETVTLCPQCEQREVRWMSVIISPYGYGISAYSMYTCCDHGECIDKLRTGATKTPSFLPFQFSVLRNFKGIDAKMIASVLKWGFGLEKPIKEKDLYKLFWGNNALEQKRLF